MAGTAFGEAAIGFRYGAASAIAWPRAGRIVVAHGGCVSFLDDTKLVEGPRVSLGATVHSLSVRPAAILACLKGGALVVLDAETLEEKSRLTIAGAEWASLAADGQTAAVVRKGKDDLDVLDRVRVADGVSLAAAGDKPVAVSAGAEVGPGLAVATLSWSGVELVRPKPAAPARIDMGDVSCHTLASDDTLLLGSTASTVRRVDVKPGGKHETTWETSIGKSRTRCVYTAHGFVGVADDEGATVLLDLAKGTEIARWKTGKGVRAVLPAPDGARALVVSQAAGNVLAPTRLALWVPGKGKAVVSKTSG